MKDNKNLKELGRRIRSMRKEIGFTQEQLAGESGLDRSYVGGIERGQRNITFTVLCQISKALNVDVAQITSGMPGE